MTGSVDEAHRRSEAYESSCRRAKTLEISETAEAYGPSGPVASPYQLPAKAGKRLHWAETVK